MSDTIFSVLVDMAQRERNTTSKRLSEAKARVDAAQAQLDALEKYRAEYNERQRARMISAGSSEGMRNFNAFVIKLESAIKQQKRELDNLQLKYDEVKAAEQNAQKRVMSFETLMDRRAEEARQISLLAERKLEDERSASAYARRRPNTSNPRFA
ncbi:MAG: flagellar export protein FliJ [Burkholderiales bacterium]